MMSLPRRIGTRATLRGSSWRPQRMRWRNAHPASWRARLRRGGGLPRAEDGSRTDQPLRVTFVRQATRRPPASSRPRRTRWRSRPHRPQARAARARRQHRGRPRTQAGQEIRQVVKQPRLRARVPRPPGSARAGLWSSHDVTTDDDEERQQRHPFVRVRDREREARLDKEEVEGRERNDGAEDGGAASGEHRDCQHRKQIHDRSAREPQVAPAGAVPPPSPGRWPRRRRRTARGPAMCRASC